MLTGFGTVVSSLGKRSKPYLPQICGTIKWRLNNKSADVRQQAADLISKIAKVMKICEEEQLMGHLGVVLYEYLGEEYPEVLGSILGALKGIVNVTGMSRMTPPVKDLLRVSPRFSRTGTRRFRRTASTSWVASRTRARSSSPRASGCESASSSSRCSRRRRRRFAEPR